MSDQERTSRWSGATLGSAPDIEAKKLKVVWTTGTQPWHHDFEVVVKPYQVDGTLIVHVTEDSMKELLKADPFYPD